jgi:hypothetical protein
MASILLWQRGGVVAEWETAVWTTAAEAGQVALDEVEPIIMYLGARKSSTVV